MAWTSANRHRTHTTLTQHPLAPDTSLPLILPLRTSYPPSFLFPHINPPLPSPRPLPHVIRQVTVTRAQVTQVQVEVDAQLERALAQYGSAVREAGRIEDSQLAEIRGACSLSAVWYVIHTPLKVWNVSCSYGSKQ